MTDVADLARRIANGHAYQKHVVTRGEFPAITDREQFMQLIADVLSSPTAVRVFQDGGRFYWHETSETIVVVDPRNPDGGTAFRPKRGRAYFDELG